MKYFFIVIIIFISFDSCAKSPNLYQQSLLYHLSAVDMDTAFIMKCLDIELPSTIEKYTIIDITDDPKFYLNNRNDLYAIKILPFEVNEGNIQVTLIDYVLRKNNEEVIMSNTGSTTYTYKYNV